MLEEPYRSRAPKSVKDNRGFNFFMIDGELTPKPSAKPAVLSARRAVIIPQPTTGMVDPNSALQQTWIWKS